MFAISKLARLVVGASLMTLPTLATAQTEAPTLNPIEPGRIALVQYTSDVHFGAYGLDEAGLKKSREVNLKNLTQLFNESVKRGAKIVVFPEGSSLGYQSHPGPDVTNFDRQITWCAPDQVDTVYRFRKDFTCVDPTPLAEAIPNGPATSYWAGLAKRAGVYVVVPTLEKIVENGKTRFANTAIVAGPNGYVTKHRKTSRWENEEYLNTILGTGPTVLQTPYGKFGLIICNGIFTPGLAEAYVAQKVDAVLFPADWVEQFFAGYAGDAKDNSFNFLSTWKKINLFSADDARAAAGAKSDFFLGSGRTGFFSKDPTVSGIKMPNKLGKDGILVLSFDFNKAPKDQVRLVVQVTVNSEMQVINEAN